MTNLIKSRSRVRDHGEVFTPDFIVNDMLNLVKDESENIEREFSHRDFEEKNGDNQ